MFSEVRLDRRSSVTQITKCRLDPAASIRRGCGKITRGRLQDMLILESVVQCASKEMQWKLKVLSVTKRQFQPITEFYSFKMQAI
jgi:hypothetical protein